MKKTLFLLFAFISAFAAQSQTNLTVTEDFESYQKDDFLGEKNSDRWKVAFNDPGSAADVKVSTTKAKSGKNSIYLSSKTQGGGPQNVYMPFFPKEKVEDNGVFDFSIWLYVPAEQGAYFDFQAKSPLLEAVAVGVYFDNSKNVLLVDEKNKSLAFTPYKQETWVKFSMKANLTTDEWTFYLNDKEFSTVSLANSSLYALNIYPQSFVSQAQFYIDDISYTLKQEPLKTLDASITPIEMKTRFLAGKTSPVKTQIRNVGTTEITSMELEINDGLTTRVQTLSNLKLKSLTNQAITLDLPYVAKVGANKMSIKVKSVNGSADENSANDLRELPLTVVVPAADKKVLGEQATGTWCQWCPRGHVLMERMAVEYPEYFVGLAVHGSGNDPMKMTPYITSLNIEGYPTVKVNRSTLVDPFELENQFFDFITKPANAKMQTDVKWANLGTRKLSVTPKAIFKDGAPNGAYKLVAILLEDSIKGTTSAYSQVNAYASGGAGEMGGFEKLPPLVPFSKIAYKHVARALLNGFNGQSKSFSNIKEGDVFELAPIEYDVPAAYDIKRLEVATALIGPNGEVSNAEMTRAANFAVAVKEVAEHPYFVSLSPNPTDDFSTISLNINTLSNIEVRLLDMNGKAVAMESYGQLEGNQRLIIETKDLPNGLYLVQIGIDNQLLTQKMMINH